MQGRRQRRVQKTQEGQRRRGRIQRRQERVRKSQQRRQESEEKGKMRHFTVREVVQVPSQHSDDSRGCLALLQHMNDPSAGVVAQTARQCPATGGNLKGK